MAMVYEIWRQDDNGNRFVVGVRPDRVSAERRIAELSRCVHKQLYWIEQRETEKDPC
ncbi:MAG TPA: hypothetical protein PLI53_07795 [Geobacteraceae bacterium]|nr:hypothetical protein [Geobacteraceae bacterium]